MKLTKTKLNRKGRFRRVKITKTKLKQIIKEEINKKILLEEPDQTQQQPDQAQQQPDQGAKKGSDPQKVMQKLSAVPGLSDLLTLINSRMELEPLIMAIVKGTAVGAKAPQEAATALIAVGQALKAKR